VLSLPESRKPLTPEEHRDAATSLPSLIPCPNCEGCGQIEEPAHSDKSDWPTEREAIRARVEAATGGPFLVEDTGTQNESQWAVKRTEDSEWIGDFGREEDADFWCTANRDLRRLLVKSEEDERESAELRIVLRAAIHGLYGYKYERAERLLR
jgi:hypothetical protein